MLKTQNEYLLHDPDYERYVQRFLKEGEMMAKLAAKESHPHLVQVLDLFSEPAPDGASAVRQHHYLVMPFIEGENLFEAVKRRGRLPEATVLTIARQIGSALEWMHQHEFVHRDAHPGNIMLRPDNSAVLIDLGGAKEFIPSSQSSTGVVGNRGFAPYEQMLNSEKIRQPSADVFCFSGSLYFAVTGQQPASSLKRKEKAALTPPQQLAPISKELNQMLMTGLKLEAAKRPQTIEELLVHLQPKPIIAWGSLVGCVAAYTVVGVGVSVGSSSVNLAVAWAWAWAVAWAVAVAWAGAGAGAVAVAWAGAVAGAGAVAWAVAVAVAVAWAGADAGAGAWAVAGAVAWAGAGAGAVAGAGVGLWRGSWELISGHEAFFLGLWWGVWPLTVGILPGLAANEMKGSKVKTIALPTIASWLGLALGVFIYRTVHPV